METILEDSRKIFSIHLPNEGIFCGSEIDEIIPYRENGQSAYVVWFSIVKGGEVIRRVNGAMVESISY